ncbi:MAG: PIG-L family deacetylase [Methanomassiliicoccales archaeon]|nr:PIG-L family deacetylase [Methanomassiliicoccales archaeon]
MDSRSLKLELRYIAERSRNRIRGSVDLARTAWSPKLLDSPPGKDVLVLAPHPDDEAIGCGGSVARLTLARKRVRVLFLSISYSDPDLTGLRKDEACASLKHLGVKEFRMCDLDLLNKADVRREIEAEVSDFSPDTVFVPSPMENIDDHLLVTDAYLDSLKGMKAPPTTAFYEVWNLLACNAIVDITSVFERKRKAIEAHASQTVDFDYLRAARSLNEYRAAISGIDGYAEALLILEAKDLHRFF